MNPWFEIRFWYKFPGWEKSIVYLHLKYTSLDRLGQFCPSSNLKLAPVKIEEKPSLGFPRLCNHKTFPLTQRFKRKNEGIKQPGSSYMSDDKNDFSRNILHNCQYRQKTAEVLLFFIEFYVKLRNEVFLCITCLLIRAKGKFGSTPAQNDPKSTKYFHLFQQQSSQRMQLIFKE